VNELQRRWEAFRLRPFPKGHTGEEVEGVCLATLDTFAAGCIDSYTGAGQLDSERHEILESCYADIETVLPELSGEGREYFEELAWLAREVLTRLSNPGHESAEGEVE